MVKILSSDKQGSSTQAQAERGWWSNNEFDRSNEYETEAELKKRKNRSAGGDSGGGESFYHERPSTNLTETDCIRARAPEETHHMLGQDASWGDHISAQPDGDFGLGMSCGGSDGDGGDGGGGD